MTETAVMGQKATKDELLEYFGHEYAHVAAALDGKVQIHDFGQKTTDPVWRTQLLEMMDVEATPMKTVYIQKEDSIVGVVLPYDGFVDEGKLSDILEHDFTSGLKKAKEKHLPFGQKKHSCGPWATQKDRFKDYGSIDKYIFQSMDPYEFTTLSDFVPPGQPKLSIVGSTGDIYKSLMKTDSTLYKMADIMVDKK